MAGGIVVQEALVRIGYQVNGAELEDTRAKLQAMLSQVIGGSKGVRVKLDVADLQKQIAQAIGAAAGGGGVAGGTGRVGRASRGYSSRAESYRNMTGLVTDRARQVSMAREEAKTLGYRSRTLGVYQERLGAWTQFKKDNAEIDKGLRSHVENERRATMELGAILGERADIRRRSMLRELKEIEAHGKVKAAQLRKEGQVESAVIVANSREQSDLRRRLWRKEDREDATRNRIQTRREWAMWYASDNLYYGGRDFIQRNTRTVADYQQSLRRASLFSANDFSMVPAFGAQAMSGTYSTPNEIAAVQRAYAQANLRPQDISQAVNPALNLSLLSRGEIGGGVTAEEAADMIASTLLAYRLPATKAGQVSSGIWSTAKNTLSSVGTLTQSLSYGAASGAFAGQSLEETLTILGTLANVERGAGSKPGILSNALIRELSAKSRQQENIFSRLGVETHMADPSNPNRKMLRPVMDIIMELHRLDQLGGMAEGNWGKIFPDKTQRGAAALVQLGLPSFEELKRAIKEGMAEGVAETDVLRLYGQDTEGSILRFKAKREQAAIDFFQSSGLDKDIQGMLNALSSIMESQKSLPQWVKVAEKQAAIIAALSAAGIFVKGAADLFGIGKGISLASPITRAGAGALALNFATGSIIVGSASLLLQNLPEIISYIAGIGKSGFGPTGDRTVGRNYAEDANPAYPTANAVKKLGYAGLVKYQLGSLGAAVQGALFGSEEGMKQKNIVDRWYAEQVVPGLFTKNREGYNATGSGVTFGDVNVTVQSTGDPRRDGRAAARAFTDTVADQLSRASWAPTPGGS